MIAQPAIDKGKDTEVGVDTRNRKSGVSRRGFLRTGALGAGAAVGFSGCGSKEERLIPLLVPEENFIPGTDRWTPGTCTLCPAGCGTLVRTMQGEAKVARGGREYRQLIVQVKKVEGNPAHPVNLGKLCARGQSIPQELYHPDRIRTPLRRTGARGSGIYQPISWDEALAQLTSKLTPLFVAGQTGKPAAIARGLSRARLQLLIDFLGAAGSDRIWIEESGGIPTLREANARVFGRRELEVHDLEHSRYLLSFGAPLLETHTSPVRYSLGLSALRGGDARKAKFVQVESRMSLTAAQSDEWLPARPGSEGALAFAMAHVLLKEELFDKESIRSSTRGFQEFRDWVLADYSPDRIADWAGVPDEKIARVAREFAAHQPGIAMAGGSALAHDHGLLTAAAVQSLNVLVGNQGRAGGFSWTASSAPNPEKSGSIVGWPADRLLAAAENIPLIVLWNCDPVQGLPAALSVAGFLERIPFVVAFGTFLNDSAVYADLVLPDQAPVERWDVVQPELTRGGRILSICQPVAKAMYESRDCAEVLLTVAAKIGGKVREELPDETYIDYLRRRLKGEGVLGHGSFASEDAGAFWEKLQEEGVWVDSTRNDSIEPADLAAVVRLGSSMRAEAGRAESLFHLQPFASTGLGFGESAHLPWMQEMPDPTTSVAWGSWAEINPVTAGRLNIREGELISLESEHGRVELPALLSPAARPDTIYVPFGQGHRFSGRYAAGRGVNPWEIIAPNAVQGTGDWAWAATMVRIRSAGKMGRLVKIG